MPQDRCGPLLAEDEAVRASRAVLAEERAWWMQERRRVFGEVREGLRPESDADEIEADWQAWAEAYPARLNAIQDDAERHRRREAARVARERMRRFAGRYAPPEVRHLPTGTQAVACAILKVCAGFRSGSAEIANGMIEGMTGASRATVKRATAQLVAGGHVAKVERRQGRYNLPNVYRVASRSLLVWARRAFRMRGGLSSEPESGKGFSPVPTHPAHERDRTQIEVGDSRSDAGGGVMSGREDDARTPEDAPGSTTGSEEAEGAETGLTPSPAPAREPDGAQHGVAALPVGAWTPTVTEIEAAHDKLARIALEEAGHALTGSASRGAVTRAVDRLRRERLDRFDEVEFQRLRGVHGRKADLAVLEVVLLTEVRKGTTSKDQPAAWRKEIADPVRYLHGILARRRSACRPEVTLGRLLKHRSRALPYEIQLAIHRHDRERAEAKSLAGSMFGGRMAA